MGRPRPVVRQDGRASLRGAAIAVLIGIVGCAEDAGPVLYAVQGQLLVDGRPATSGAVSLRPVDSKLGHQPTGSVSPDGGYIVYTSGRAGAPPGEYRVVVFVNEDLSAATSGAHPPLPRSLIDPVYHDPDRTPLRVTVTADAPSGAYDLEVQHAVAK
jgi:hypothetical protein